MITRSDNPDSCRKHSAVVFVSSMLKPDVFDCPIPYALIICLVDFCVYAVNVSSQVSNLFFAACNYVRNAARILKQSLFLL